MRLHQRIKSGLWWAGLLCIGLIITGCHSDQGQKQEADANESHLTITDSVGRLVTIDQPVERVAILDTGTAEILKAFGVIDRLTGNHQGVADNPLFPELQDVPVVATYSEVNYEKLAEGMPQVVFSSVRAHGVVDEQAHLQAFGIKDVKLNLRNPDVIKEEVRLLGQIFQKEEKAQQLIDFYNKYEQLISTRIKQVPLEDRPTIFVENHAGDFHTGGPGSRFYEQTLLAGAVNIAASLSGEPQVAAEWVAEQNPDVILREASGFGYGVETYDQAEAIYNEILSRPALAQTNAWQNGAIYLVGIDIYSRPAYIVGVSYLAKWLYPELFHDLDPGQVHQEYFALFHPGMPYKGVWTYSGQKGDQQHDDR